MAGVPAALGVPLVIVLEPAGVGMMQFGVGDGVAVPAAEVASGVAVSVGVPVRPGVGVGVQGPSVGVPLPSVGAAAGVLVVAPAAVVSVVVAAAPGAVIVSVVVAAAPGAVVLIPVAAATGVCSSVGAPAGAEVVGAGALLGAQAAATRAKARIAATMMNFFMNLRFLLLD